MEQGHVRLDRVEFLVLDEADRMLDMGFIRDVRKIVAALPAERQSLLFSATMPAEVGRLAAEMLRDPIRVDVSPKVVTVDKVEQRVMFVEAKQKRNVLAHLLSDPALTRVLVFTRTKHGANRVSADLEKAGVDAAAIHGNKSQQARQRALEGFRSGNTRVLVATDIAARGIDVDGVTHVINFELPNEPESYVHRIGRTARAGADGIAISLCDGSERSYLRSIERLTRRSIKVEDARGVKVMEAPVAAAPRPAAPPRPPAPPRPAAKTAPNSHRNGNANGAPRPAKRRRSGGNAPMHRGSQQHRVA